MKKAGGVISERQVMSKIMRKYGITNLKKLNGLALFGAGKLGQIYLTYFRKAKINVACFIDNDPSKWGKKFAGKKVVSPDYLKQNPEIVVVITSRHVREIAKQLKAMKLRNVIPHYILAAKFQPQFPEMMHQTVIDLIAKNNKEISKVREALCDQKSRCLFEQILKFRLSLEPSKVPKFLNLEKYFYNKNFGLSKEETFVDVGAYDGDTLKLFLESTKGRFNHYFALEPDPISYQKLLCAVPSDFENKITVLQVGAGSKRGQVGFSGGGQLESTISTNGNHQIEIVPLDELCQNQKITTIKMDVEGYEAEVIKGAKKVIKKQKPKLCVSVYHNPWDLWRLPLQILEYHQYKNIYLRQYGEGLIETTLYMA